MVGGSWDKCLQKIISNSVYVGINAWFNTLNSQLPWYDKSFLLRLLIKDRKERFWEKKGFSAPYNIVLVPYCISTEGYRKLINIHNINVH